MLAELPRLPPEDVAFLSPAHEIIEDARRGRMVVLVDDEDRENEGDLYIPAAFADAAAINFMARYGRGLICLALPLARCRTLGLPLMAQGNEPRLSTAFTVSVEARTGVTTGISAADRARTVAVCIDPAADRHHLVSPGHVFPLMARDGGVLVRAGHTEAAVDIARLAGLDPSGVICEIMNDDGSMARLPDLLPFAQLHGLKVGTIADLIAWRLRHDRLIERRLEAPFVSRFGGAFTLHAYENLTDGTEQVALVKGDLSGPEPVLVRVHAHDLMEDLLGLGESGRGDQLHRAMELIGAAGRGVIVFLRDATTRSLGARLTGAAAPHPSPHQDLRVYGIGAQILADLGVVDMVLLTNSERTLVGLEGFHLRVVGTRALGGAD